MTHFNESMLEQTALSWFADLGYEVRHGEEIAPGGSAAERDSYGQAILVGRLRDAVERLNPGIPAQALEEAVRKVLYPESPSLVVNNRRFHAMLRDGVEVEYRRPDGSIAGDRVRLTAVLQGVKMDGNTIEVLPCPHPIPQVRSSASWGRLF